MQLSKDSMQKHASFMLPETPYELNFIRTNQKPCNNVFPLRVSLT